MNVLKRLGLVLLILLALAGSAGSAVLYQERQEQAAQIAQQQREIEQYKEQITNAAAIQKENQRLQDEVEELQQQAASPVTPTQGQQEQEQEQTQPTPTPGASALPEEQQAILDEIGAQVSAMRGLPELAPPTRDLMSRDQLRQYIEEEMDQENSPEDWRNSEEMYWLLGMLPKDIDLRQLLLDMQTEGILGFYDHETKSFYVISDNPSLSAMDKLTYAHEFDHHLQDQHFDLQQLLPDEVEDDRGLAIRALVEGDASLLMEEWLVQHMQPEEIQELIREQLSLQTPVLDSAPAIVRESLVFPYTEGLAFVRGLRASGGWAAVDQALRNPPTSTEQILHPEKYTGPQRDEPQQVSLPSLAEALPGWEEVDSNTLGEFDFRLFLTENGVQGPQAASAAAGWGGARYGLYRNDNPEQTVLVIATTWDSEQEAVEFEEALLSTLQPAGEIFRRGEVSLAIQRQGERLSMAFSADSGLIERVAKALP